jgi:membrane fusion protein (multidrug efflux system)
MDAEARKDNNHKKALVLIVILLLVASGLGYYWWSRGRVTTDDAYVDGHIFSITPRIAGFVTKVFVTDNQKVQKGEPLLSLDITEYEVALAEANASLAEAESTLTSLELGVPLEVSQTAQRVRGAQAQLDSLRKTLDRVLKDEEAAAQDLKRAEALYDLSTIELRRTRELVKTKAVPESRLDESEAAARSNEAQVGAARAKLESVRKQKASLEAEMGGLKANVALAATGEDVAVIKARQVEAQKAKVQLARSRLKQAELDLAYTTVPSPVDGHVTRKRVEPGLMVSRGQPLMAVVPLNPEDLWITANFKETQLTKVDPGQEVIIKVDTYPGLRLRGKVDSIMAGTGSVFSLFPPENATGNFVKVVQRIPVKITLDLKGQPAPPSLRIGMSVIPTILLAR